MWTPIEHIILAKDDTKFPAWDSHNNTPVMISKLDIPHTYTLTKKPTNKGREYDLWRFTCTLINHHILFHNGDGALKTDTYAKATSETNRQFRGRYNAYRCSPKLKGFDALYGPQWFPQEHIKNCEIASRLLLNPTPCLNTQPSP